MNIKTKQEIYFENVLKFRSTLTQNQMQVELEQIMSFISSNNLIAEGPIITTTYEVQQINDDLIFDVEYIVPVSNIFNSDKYVYCTEFYLTNALLCTRQNNFESINSDIEMMNDYMQNSNLVPITTPYIFQYNTTSAKDVYIEVYISINPNIV